MLTFESGSVRKCANLLIDLSNLNCCIVEQFHFALKYACPQYTHANSQSKTTESETNAHTAHVLIETIREGEHLNAVNEGKHSEAV